MRLRGKRRRKPFAIKVFGSGEADADAYEDGWVNCLLCAKGGRGGGGRMRREEGASDEDDREKDEEEE